jgi:hypothetical protein
MKLNILALSALLALVAAETTTTAAETTTTITAEAQCAKSCMFQAQQISYLLLPC